MDIEKLIERLKHNYHGYSTVENNPEETFHDMVECLTALSTLQAENEKLRYEVERQRRSADDRQHLYENAERAYMKVLAEMEQARAEITRLKHYEDKCHDCPIVCAKREIIKAHEELEAAQNERDMWKEGMEDCQQSILELEAELEQAKRERDAAISDLTYIAQTYPVDLCDDLVCQYCKHYPNVNTGCPGWAENDCFEWRGPEEG